MFWTLLLVVACDSDSGGDDSGAPQGGESLEEAILALDGDPVAGESLYEANCSTCHGADGSGVSAPDIRSRSQSVIVNAAVNGRTGMPSFADDLSEQELADLSAFAEEL